MKTLKLVLQTILSISATAELRADDLSVTPVATVYSYDRNFGSSVSLSMGFLATSSSGTPATVYDLRGLPAISSVEIGVAEPGGCIPRFFGDWLVITANGPMASYNTFANLVPAGNWNVFYWNGFERTCDADFGVFPIIKYGELWMYRRSGPSQWTYEGTSTVAVQDAHMLSATAMLVERSAGDSIWTHAETGWAESPILVPPFFTRRLGDSIVCASPFESHLRLFRFVDSGFSDLGDFPFPPAFPAIANISLSGPWALSGDLLAIGCPDAAPNEVICGASAGNWHDGAVLIYRRLPSGGFEYVSLINNPSPTRPNSTNGMLCRQDRFGRSVAWDGRRLAVGCAEGSQASNRAVIHVVDVLIDCDGNGVHDAEQITSGASPDVNSNGIPDPCEINPCAGDVTGNGVIDGVDLAAVLGVWGTAGQGKFPTDINLDGTVNAADLAYLLSNWGDCPR